MGRAMKIARRGFLFGSVAILGGVAFGWYRYATPYGNPLEAGLGAGEATLNPYVLINADGVTVIAPRAEMGQGVHTTLAARLQRDHKAGLLRPDLDPRRLPDLAWSLAQGLLVRIVSDPGLAWRELLDDACTALIRGAQDPSAIRHS